MTNLNPPSSLRSAPTAPATPLRGMLKSALAVLVLFLLALLLWQLVDQFQRTLSDQRQHSIDASAERVARLDLNLALNSQTALNRLLTTPPFPSGREKADTLARLQQALPAVQSILWLAADGRILADTLPVTADENAIQALLQRAQIQPFYYANAADARLYLLIRQPGELTNGAWLLRLAPSFLGGLLRADSRDSHAHWQIESRQDSYVIHRDNDAGQANSEQTLLVTPLAQSDWQLRSLFNADRARLDLLPALIGKCLLGLAFSLLPLLTLLNLRKRQREVHEERRRYQDIFEGTGVALCVLDLSALRDLIQNNGLISHETLQAWLDESPERRASLLSELRITEVNQVALRLLAVESIQEAWQRLIDGGPMNVSGIGYQIIDGLMRNLPQLELEVTLTDPFGLDQHLWLTLRFPEDIWGYHAVILNINDITSRKRVELSLVEREAFWSDVIRTVPDHLYVQDCASQRMIFSNHHLGQTLGYGRAQLQELGEYFWEKLLHIEDALTYNKARHLQRQSDYALPLNCLLRFRSQDSQWRYFEVREQVLARDKDGMVTRIVGVAKDVTEQLEASESLRDSEQRYRMLAESISDVIFSTNNKLKLNYVSHSVQAVLGYDEAWIFANGWQSTIANPSQLIGLNQMLERVGTALDDPEQLAQLRTQVQSKLFLLDCLNADGRKIPIELRLVLVWDENGVFEGILGVGRDVSQQRRAEKDLRMAATVFEHSTSAILITDPAGYIVQANEAFSRVSGYAVSQVLDQLPTLLTVDDQQEAHLRYVLKQLNQRGTWEGEVWLKRRSGEHYPAWVGITAVLDDEGDLASYVCFFSDISERKASEQRIHRLAYYDALTHLPNRTLFQDRLHNALQQADRQGGWVVLMFLDLDRFKPINDSLGHAAGDRMLKDMATRLLACVNDDDTVARMGGDEFTLLLQPRAAREEALHEAIHVAEQILASLVKPFVLENREFFVTASIGIALSPQDGNELSQLMKNADTAMYHAKERGKNNFQFYQADMNASALERLELESDLRHALEQQEFILYYQPQFSGDGKRLTGAEALLRWRHPRRGLVPPGDFIPVLEELGLVVDVGDWVISEACRQLKEWHATKVRVPKVSVNISARQFSDGQLGTRIATILGEVGLSPACLELELTESILMREVNEAMMILDSLKQLGLSIAVDDFGTGYSSLNYLKQFPIDVLKIDRSFVDGLPSGEQDAQIARAIIAMAHSLNLSVIAEGVETQDQLDFLREHGCDEVQGYLFGRPMPASRFEAQFSNDALFMLD
ncbi:EAL domain-containing protein [Pseudomonas sp. dw_358]|uniref:EAL domain-containing protein n=1 Tax=Pseudomonas sp. dw_358 TaxID=2720083 RepID=UPI001BD5FD04|nr:EAL domain-containing protein [Pseudomonas sp. dw_358]